MRSVPSGATERAFSVADALVLIGAAAAGLALVRGWQEPYWCSIHIGFYPEQTSSLARRIQHAISVGISWTIPFALTLTIALVALRFRSPHVPANRTATRCGGVRFGAGGNRIPVGRRGLLLGVGLSHTPPVPGQSAIPAIRTIGQPRLRSSRRAVAPQCPLGAIPNPRLPVCCHCRRRRLVCVASKRTMAIRSRLD
jgi:hypothetical protein